MWRYGRIAVVFVLIFFAARSTYRVSRRAVRAHAKALLDRVEANEERFARVRRRLPGSGTIEYRCLGRDDATDAVRDRYMAQYVLTPLVLDVRRPHEWVVEDRPVVATGATVPPTSGLQLIFDADNGIRLYRRTAP